MYSKRSYVGAMADIPWTGTSDAPKQAINSLHLHGLALLLLFNLEE
jgi:hypothetical protein